MKSLNFALVAISVVVLGLFDSVITVALSPPRITGIITLSNTQSDDTHYTHTHISVSSGVTEHSKRFHDCTSAACLPVTREVDVRAEDEAASLSEGSGGLTQPRHTPTHSSGSGGVESPACTDIYWQPDPTSGVQTSYVISHFVPEYMDSTRTRPSVPATRLPLEDRSEMPPTGAHTGTHPEHNHGTMYIESSHSHGIINHESTHRGPPHQEPTHIRERTVHFSESHRDRLNQTSSGTHVTTHLTQRADDGTDQLFQHSRTQHHSEWSTGSHTYGTPHHAPTHTLEHTSHSSQSRHHLPSLTSTGSHFVNHLTPRAADGTDRFSLHSHTQHHSGWSSGSQARDHTMTRPYATESFVHPGPPLPIRTGIHAKDDAENPYYPEHTHWTHSAPFTLSMHRPTRIPKVTEVQSATSTATGPFEVRSNYEDQHSDPIPCENGWCPGNLCCYGHDAFYVAVCQEDCGPEVRGVPPVPTHNVYPYTYTTTYTYRPTKSHYGPTGVTAHVPAHSTGVVVVHGSCNKENVRLCSPFEVPHHLPNKTCLCVSIPDEVTPPPAPTVRSTGILPTFEQHSINSTWYTVHVTALTTLSTVTGAPEGSISRPPSPWTATTLPVVTAFDPSAGVSVNPSGPFAVEFAKRSISTWTQPTFIMPSGEGGPPGATTLNSAHPKPSKSTTFTIPI